MAVNRSFVFQNEILVRAMDDAHDVHIAKLGAALAPVAMRHDGMAADLRARALLHALRHAPVEQAVEASHSLARF